MNIIIINLIITAAIVYIYDIVDFPHNLVARGLSWIFKKDIQPSSVRLPKIFECSLCASTWTTLVLFAIFDWRLIPLCFVYGFITTYISSLINIVDKLIKLILLYIDTGIDTLYNKIRI